MESEGAIMIRTILGTCLTILATFGTFFLLFLIFWFSLFDHSYGYSAPVGGVIFLIPCGMIFWGSYLLLGPNRFRRATGGALVGVGGIFLFIVGRGAVRSFSMSDVSLSLQIGFTLSSLLIVAVIVTGFKLFKGQTD
jgi:hypothetical protein